jgi:hypothetical protein
MGADNSNKLYTLRRLGNLSMKYNDKIRRSQ